jgi:uncharacterized tellurite resistance protein B-like protein
MPPRNRDQQDGQHDHRTGQAALHQPADGPARQRAYHDHFAVRKVDQADDAVHHRVAEGDQRIHAAEHQTVDDLLQQYFHLTKTGV